MRTLLLAMVGLIMLVGCASSEERLTIAPASAPSEGPMARPPARERVRMTTSAGTIVLELDREKAPVSVANFLGYVHVNHGCPRGDYGVSYSGQNHFRHIKPGDFL